MFWVPLGAVTTFYGNHSENFYIAANGHSNLRPLPGEGVVAPVLLFTISDRFLCLLIL